MGNSKMKRLLEEGRDAKVSKHLDYMSLGGILQEAYERASKGKGYQRHAKEGLPFEKQDIVTEQLEFGIGVGLAQIRKKAKEAFRLDNAAAQRELLDVIVYAAGTILTLREK